MSELCWSRFRVIYREVSAGVVDLVAVGPRRTIYEETARLSRRFLRGDAEECSWARPLRHRSTRS